MLAGDTVEDTNVLDEISKDHDKLLKEMEDLKYASTHTSGARESLYDTLRLHMLRHMYGEERVFYPVLEGTIRDKILEAIEEHNVMKSLLQQMDDLPKDDERWTAKLKVMEENMKHHIREEEGGIFKVTSMNFNREQLDDMGRRFEEAKESLRP
jgi:hemerythrin-like domain-containing protein